MSPKRQETKGYLDNTYCLGGQSQAELVRMGRVVEPEIMPRQNPQMRKSPGLRFDKDSGGYPLCPSLHATSCLTPV